MNEDIAKQVSALQRSLLGERSNVAFAMVDHNPKAKSSLKALLGAEFDQQIKVAGIVPAVQEIVDTLETIIARYPHLGLEKKAGAQNLTEIGIKAKVRKSIADAYGLKQ